MHPIWHRINFSKLRAYISVGFIWAIGFVFNTAHIIPSTYIMDNTCFMFLRWPSEFVQHAFGVFAVTFQYIFPLVLLVFCYARIVHCLTAKVPKTEESKEGPVAATPAKEDHYQRARNNTVKTLVVVAVCFVICWSPNQIYFLMMNLGYPWDFSSTFYHFTVFMVFLNSCINPFIYSLKYQPFQTAALEMFCKKCKNKKRVADEASSTTTTDA